MRIAIGSDHGGFELKQKIITILSKEGVLEISDFGTYSTDPVDYPDISFMVATEVARKNYDFGILIDGIGVGSCIAANKVKGILAATCNEVTTAKSARAHDNANVIVLGSGIIGLNLALEIINTFLNTGFAGGRHEKRLNKIFNYENANSKIDLERFTERPKRILTKDDIQLAFKAGETVVYVDKTAIITPLAKELALDKNIRIIVR